MAEATSSASTQRAVPGWLVPAVLTLVLASFPVGAAAIRTEVKANQAHDKAETLQRELNSLKTDVQWLRVLRERDDAQAIAARACPEPRTPAPAVRQ